MLGFWSERPIPPEFHKELEGVAKIIGSGTVASDDFHEVADDVHVIIASASVSYDDAFMDKVPNLKVISRTGIGVDNISLSAATARKIAVCNTPNVPTNSTAEHAISLMMAVTKHLKRAETILHRKNDSGDYFSQHQGIELEGACLGVVGLGRIGSKVAQKALGLGMRVVAYDPFASEKQFANTDIEQAATLEALLRTADVVSLHLPSTPETHHLINAERLAQMKAGSYVINTSRGSLVDEHALLDALERGQLRGAGLDVFDPEPPAADNPLLHRDDVFTTPHIGGVTFSSRRRFWQESIGQAMQVLKGERPANLVNSDVWPLISDQ